MQTRFPVLGEAIIRNLLMCNCLRNPVKDPSLRSGWQNEVQDDRWAVQDDREMGQDDWGRRIFDLNERWCKKVYHSIWECKRQHHTTNIKTGEFNWKSKQISVENWYWFRRLCTTISRSDFQVSSEVLVCITPVKMSANRSQYHRDRLQLNCSRSRFIKYVRRSITNRWSVTDRWV